MKNMLVAQSGGPSAAINATITGVIDAGLASSRVEHVYGALNGIKGVLNENFVMLDDICRSTETRDLLAVTPAAALGSCRWKLKNPEEDQREFEEIIRILRKNNIGYFIYTGGNDSMDTVAKLSDYLAARNSKIRVIGIPKTIDNDLPVTDHTPGFGSAAKYVAATVQEIIRDSSVYSIESVTIVEIMGRHAGWLTASTCVLRANDEIAPHLIYLPENNFTAEKFLEDIRNQMAKHKAVIIAVSEGVKLKGEENKPRVVDNFGHEYLSGIGKTLEQLVKENIGCKVRSIELNVMQRCSSHICSKTDIDEAEEIGSAGVKAALAGKTGKMMIFKRISDVPYVVTVDSVDAHDAANKEKFFPAQWLSEDGNDVKPEAVRYFLPLIQGEVKIAMKNGMPVHFKL